MFRKIIESQFRTKELREKLRAAGSPVRAERLAGFSLALFALFLVLSIPALLLSPLACAALLALGLLSLRVPSIFAGFAFREKVKAIEAQLPFALRYFSALLRIGVMPERALSKVSESDFGPFGLFLEEAVSQSAKGKPLDSALSDIEGRYGSQKISEAVSVIIQTLHSGSSETACSITERLAMRLIAENENEYRAYAARSQLLLLSQLAVGAILPSVLAFLIALGGFLRGAAAVYFLFLVLLPLISLVQLAYLKSRHPG